MDLVRVDFALIPASSLFDAVVTASQAITDMFCYNENVIDAKTFPPHVSLHICIVSRSAVDQVAAEVEDLAAAGLPDLVPTEVEPASGGYVMLGIERTKELMTLHEAVLATASRARYGHGPSGSPHTGNAFSPHLSLAKLDRHDQAEGAAIARKTLAGMSTARTQTVDLCEIGHRSERWDVLASFPVTQHP